MATTYTNQDLEDLYNIVRASGWTTLNKAESLAVTRFARRNNLPLTDMSSYVKLQENRATLPTPAINQEASTPRLYDEDGTLIGMFINNVVAPDNGRNQIQQYYKAVSRAVKKNPNQWILLKQVFANRKSAQSCAHSMRTGKSATWRSDSGKFEAVVQTIEEKNYIAIRFIPHAKDSHDVK